MISFTGLKIEEVFKNRMYQGSAFSIDAWGFRKLFNHSVFIETRTVIKFADSTGGEANMGHIRDDTATEVIFLA